MSKGYLLYNGFWNPATPPEPVIQLQQAAAAHEVNLTVLPNTSATVDLSGEVLSVPPFLPGDYALFWDKDVRLARAMEALGVRVFNTADAIAVCDDKAATHLCLAAIHVPMPRTLVAPMAYTHITAPIESFLEKGEKSLGFPLVVKECFGSLGGQVFLAENAQQLRQLAYAMGAKPFLLQQYIAAAAGTDIRLYVVGNHVIAAMRRRSDSDFRANIGLGGHAENYTPTPAEIDLTLRCCTRLGVEMAGVDLLHDENGKPLVCEVNSNAYMTAISHCTGVPVADAIVRYVLAHKNTVAKTR